MNRSRQAKKGSSSRLVASLSGRQDSMNLLARGKRKFDFQPHIDKKTRRLSLFPIQKSEQFAKPITPKLRQAVKPGRNRIDPVGESASFRYSQTFHP
jgi:hypothetical protein